MNGKVVTTIACLMAALLLLSATMPTALCESVTGSGAENEQLPDQSGDTNVLSETDLIYYTALGTGSAVAGGVIGSVACMAIYTKIMNSLAFGGTSMAAGTGLARLWTIPVSALAGVGIAMAIASLLFFIGYEIYG